MKFSEEYLYVTRIEIVSYFIAFIYKHVIFLTYKNLILLTNFSTNKKEIHLDKKEKPWILMIDQWTIHVNEQSISDRVRAYENVGEHTHICAHVRSHR